MPKAPSFYEVISDAIRDFAENGYDDIARLERWLMRIRSAAEESMTPASTLERVLNERMRAIFEKTVERGHVLKLHPGVSRYMVEKLKPAMRAELDRRIVANANLIRLNRTEAINKTLHRFSGWATSIPKGGLAEPKKREASQNIRKSMTDLKFRDRRVTIDQSAKLFAAISDILAQDGNAIAARWVSHWRRPGYQFRKEHKERDGKVYAIRGSWAIEQRLMTKGAGYTDEFEMPAQLPYCSCNFVYYSALRDLPDEMLTPKGRAELMRVRVAA